MMQLDHEKLEVYKVSLEFSGFVAGILGGLDGNCKHLKDQLARASLSIPLNIAEGNGKRSHADRRRYFEISRGSAMECAATLDVMLVYGVCAKERVDQGKALLYRIISMLTRLIGATGNMIREDEVQYGAPEAN